MIELLSCFRNPYHPIRLNSEFRRDLQWWYEFLSVWNGTSFWLYPGIALVHGIEVVSDASGAIGYGAFFNREWFNGKWLASQSIELFPVVLAAHVWGSRWVKQHALFRSNN